MNKESRGRERAGSGDTQNGAQKAPKPATRAAPSHAQIQRRQEAPLQPAGQRGDGGGCLRIGGHHHS